MDTENIGRVVTYVGVMGSGKTKKLISLYEEIKNDGLRVAVFKPFIARKGEGDGFVYARDGRMAPALAINFLDEIPAIVDQERLDAILIDEVQFFDDEEPQKLLEGLALAGLEIYVFGLDVTSDNETFGSIGDILAHSDEVHKLRAPCVKCGEEARISKFMGGKKGGVVQVGDLGDYEPHCRACHYGWHERLERYRKTMKLTLGGNDFFFTCEVETDRIRELGYDPDTIVAELTAMDKIVEFIGKLKKVE